jgi:branched-chain amino acid transport system substrate-binding protein
MGPSVTPTSLAVIDTVSENKVPTIALGSIRQITSPVDAKRRWVFKTIANDDIYVESMVNHMVKKGIKTIGMIAVNDSYGESWIEQTKRFTAERGIKILSIERFERADNSTVPQALRLVKSNPDAILIAAVGTPAVTPHHSLKERGYKGVIYQSGGAANPDFLRVGGKDVDGTYVVGSCFIVADQLPEGYPTKKAAAEFIKLYESKYGPRSNFAAYPWDGMKIVEAAIPAALKTGAKPGTVQFREALRTALENVKGVAGVGAVYNMSPTDHVGIDQRGVAVMRVENGTWKLEQAAAF